MIATRTVESFQAAIFRLTADLLGKVREGMVSPESANADLRQARRELLRAMTALERLAVRGIPRT